MVATTADKMAASTVVLTVDSWVFPWAGHWVASRVES
jgi:hypothetical protein